MYSELPGDIVFYVNGSPNNIYGIDMTTGWVNVTVDDQIFDVHNQYRYQSK